MADTAVAITAGTGTNIDTRTEGTNGNHRQVIVVGDPANNAGVAPVDATNGLSVSITNASLTVASHAVTNAGTFAVQESGAALTALQLIDDPVATLGTTTYTEATTKGMIAGAVRRDANTSLVDTTNEVAPLQVNATGELKVAQIQALPAGTNAIGKLAANSGVDIGDVDVTTLGGQSPAYGAGAANSSTLRVTIDNTQFSTLGQTTKSASAPITIASDQGYAGNVGGITTLFPVTLSLDTSAYASGDVLADTQVLTSLFRITDGTGVLQSIQVIDQDDQKQAIDFYYLSANNSIGTENSAPNISDANAIEMVGPFSVAAADYKDLGGVSVAKISNIGQPIIAVSGTANGYIAAICNSGTPTYTASGIKLRLGILRD